jgi:hypothetical protein
MRKSKNINNCSFLGEILQYSRSKKHDRGGRRNFIIHCCGGTSCHTVSNKTKRRKLNNSTVEVAISKVENVRTPFFSKPNI